MDPENADHLEEDPGTIRITTDLVLPVDEIRFRFSRSGGPGGQHVNRSETRVELLFDVARSPSLSEDQRARIMQRLQNQIDSEGVLRIVSAASRSQAENRAYAVARFQALLASSLRERKRRVPTRPSRSARERRLSDKRQRSTLKAGRGQIRNADTE